MPEGVEGVVDEAFYVLCFGLSFDRYKNSTGSIQDCVKSEVHYFSHIPFSLSLLIS